MKLHVFLLSFLGFAFLWANTPLAEYADMETQDLRPDITCRHEENKSICEALEFEWIEGVLVQKLRYTFEQKDDMLLHKEHIALQTQNLNFEGYNIAPLMPDSIHCKEVAKLIESQSHKALQTQSECTLQSHAYHIVAVIHSLHTNPIYTEAQTPLDAILRYKVATKQQPEYSILHYKMGVKNISIAIQSHSLNTILFDLYKRERRIANTEGAQNDKNYKMVQDSTLTQEYMQFLAQTDGILAALKEHDIKEENIKNVQKILNGLTQIATKPDQKFTITLESDSDFVLTNDEIFNLLNLDTSFFESLVKILKHTRIQVA